MNEIRITEKECGCEFEVMKSGKVIFSGCRDSRTEVLDFLSTLTYTLIEGFRTV